MKIYERPDLSVSQRWACEEEPNTCYFLDQVNFDSIAARSKRWQPVLLPTWPEREKCKHRVGIAKFNGSPVMVRRLPHHDDKRVNVLEFASGHLIVHVPIENLTDLRWLTPEHLDEVEAMYVPET